MKIEDSAIPTGAEEPARFEAEEASTPLKVKAQISLEQSAGRREIGAEGI